MSLQIHHIDRTKMNQPPRITPQIPPGQTRSFDNKMVASDKIMSSDYYVSMNKSLFLQHARLQCNAQKIHARRSCSDYIQLDKSHSMLI